MMIDYVMDDLLARFLGRRAPAGACDCKYCQLQRLEARSPSEKRRLTRERLLLAVATYVIAAVFGWAMIGVLVTLWWGGR